MSSLFQNPHNCLLWRGHKVTSGDGVLWQMTETKKRLKSNAQSRVKRVTKETTEQSGKVLIFHWKCVCVFVCAVCVGTCRGHYVRNNKVIKRGGEKWVLSEWETKELVPLLPGGRWCEDDNFDAMPLWSSSHPCLDRHSHIQICKQQIAVHMCMCVFTCDRARYAHVGSKPTLINRFDFHGWREKISKKKEMNSRVGKETSADAAGNLFASSLFSRKSVLAPTSLATIMRHEDDSFDMTCCHRMMIKCITRPSKPFEQVHLARPACEWHVQLHTHTNDVSKRKKMCNSRTQLLPRSLPVTPHAKPEHDKPSGLMWTTFNQISWVCVCVHVDTDRQQMGDFNFYLRLGGFW